MIPSTITQLTSLTILNLVGNQLSRLPVGIASIPKITAIWLAENQVWTVSVSVSVSVCVSL